MAATDATAVIPPPRLAGKTAANCTSELPIVLALVTTDGLRHRIASAVLGAAVPTFVYRSNELLSSRLHRPPALVLLEESPESDRLVIPIVQRISRRFPSTRIVVLSKLTPQHARWLLEQARAGVSTVVFPEFDDLSSVLRAEIAITEQQGQTRGVLEACPDYWPENVREIVLYCVEHATRRLTTEELAFGIGISRKTLTKRLAIASLPCPSRLISLTRLMTALWRLEHLGCSVEHAATGAGFDSATGLRNMLRRHTGLTLAEVQKRGGLTHLVCRLDPANRWQRANRESQGAKWIPETAQKLEDTSCES